MTFRDFCDLVDESPTRRRGGRVFRMETPAEARARRRPATPRRDYVQNRSLIYGHMIEREGRPDAAAYNAAARVDLLTEIRSRQLAEMAARIEKEERE